jgi:hypothetical protein
MGVRATLVAVGVLASVVFMTAPAWATGGTKLCIPTGENAPVKTPLKNGTCASTKTEKFTLTELGAEGKEGKQGPEGKEGKEGKEGPEGKLPLSDEEAATLKGILPCITSVEKGVDEKPTVQFHGCNVQIVNGAGKTATTNGEGNLVIGYDEREGGKCSFFFARDKGECELLGGAWTPEPQAQTGSHDLILGNEQTFTSYGGIIAGQSSSVTGAFASVTGGFHNTASNLWSSVSGGAGNTASGRFASVSGGSENTASGSEGAWVGGGKENSASGLWSSVSGGRGNNAAGIFSSIFGGKNLTATGEYEAIP